MQNLLPSINDMVAKAPEASRVTHWSIAEADPATAVISKQLIAAFHVDAVKEVKYKPSLPTKNPPNYISPAVVASIGPSPLDAVTRSHKEKPQIDISSLKLETDDQQRMKALRKLRQKQPKSSLALYINASNLLPITQDIYMQFLKSMRVTPLESLTSLTRLLDGDPKTSIYSSSTNAMHILLAPLNRITIPMTSRQELRLFTFDKAQRIGLEIELINNRLTVTRVIPNTQAAELDEHEQNLLKDAVLVAVNEDRVLDLREFQSAMRKAKMSINSNHIHLLLAVYKGGKSKVDELYAHDFSRHQRVKSILSNIFSKGVDGKDHINVMMDGSSVGSAEDDSHHDDDDDDEDDNKADNEADNQAGAKKEEKHANDSKVTFADIKGNDSKDKDDIEQSKALQAASEEWTAHSDTSDNEANIDDEDNNGGMIAQRKVVKRDLHINIREPTINNTHAHNASIDSEDSSTIDNLNNEWNALTAVSQSQIFAYSTLVCVPRELSCSTGWGHPKRYLQLTNFSSSWKLDVAWIDEQGSLIPRTEIKGPMGTVHFELISEDHVWLITAKPNVNNGAFKAGSLSLSLSSSMIGQHASEAKIPDMIENNPANTTVEEILTPITLAFRPCRAAVQEGKCASLIWTPWSSISVSQQIVAQKNRRDRGTVPDRIQPVVHVQLFETPPAVLQRAIDKILLDREELEFDDTNDGQIKKMLHQSRQASMMSMSQQLEEEETTKKKIQDNNDAKIIRRPLLTSKTMSKMRKK